VTEVIVVGSQAEAGELVARSILRLIGKKPDAVLGLATGSTPLPVYHALAGLLAANPVDVSRVRGFALDEYVGLAPENPQSYRSIITREVVEPLGLNPALIQVPNGAEATAEHAGEEYERAIVAAGGIDVQLLGIGTDGHIGFNEPGSSFESLTRVKTLTRQTREDNARFFPSPADVPVHCVTQGLGTIRRARRLLLLAFGEGKARAVAGAVEGPVTASNPASAIQLHPKAAVILDEAAASQLANLDYYRFVWDNKPPWQQL
jgi:glucosamine-6-phosphate deaminase